MFHIFSVRSLKLKQGIVNKTMTNGYLIFNKDKSLVPDVNYQNVDEDIDIEDGHYYSTDKAKWYEHLDSTFHNTSIIRMLTLCADALNRRKYAACDIRVLFTDVLGHEVIRFNSHCTLFIHCKYYHIFPHGNNIRIVTSMEEDDMLNLYNPIYADLSKDTYVGELYNIIRGERTRFKSFTKFMKNVKAYNDIIFEFVSE